VPDKSLGNTGAMIAFYPSADVASLLFGQTAGGLPVGGRAQTPDDMHVTLLYLGDAATVADQEAALSAVLESYAASREPVDVLLNGLARFYTLEDDETNPVVVTVDSPALPDLRQDLLSLVRSVGVEPVLNHGFVPHVTIAYTPWDGPTPVVNFQPLIGHLPQAVAGAGR
jgi:2'-5' RNA ligase